MAYASCKQLRHVNTDMFVGSPRVFRGNAEMYRRSGLIISHEQALRYDAGSAVPVLMSLWFHVYGALLVDVLVVQ